jgi:hypothetical protein
VTILPSCGIPAELRIDGFSDGILFYVVIVTSIIMMIGAFFFRPETALDKTSA